MGGIPPITVSQEIYRQNTQTSKSISKENQAISNGVNGVSPPAPRRAWEASHRGSLVFMNSSRFVLSLLGIVALRIDADVSSLILFSK